MSGELGLRMSALAPGDHLCMIYESAAEQRAALVPYFKEGLARGERCAYIADTQAVEELQGVLGGWGIDVQNEVKRGALRMLTKREAYLRRGKFDPEEMLEFVREATDEALADGFSGLRATGEMTWALGPEPGNDRLIEYEALLTNVFTKPRRLIGLCQYDRARFAPEIIRDVLRTHPIAVLGEQVCSNLYYEPPELVLGRRSQEERVQWMIAQLKRTREIEQGLEQALRARDEFLSIASHELRGPMTSLGLAVQSLRKGALSPETEARVIELAGQQVKRLEALVTQLLDVSRINSKGIDLAIEEIDLAAVAREVVERMAPRIEQARCTVSLRAPTSAWGRWDRSRLDQLLTNLLDNAVKFGAERPVEVAVEADTGAARLSVADHGIGIPRERIPHIFERFERGVSWREYGGLGLGLYVAKQIVDAHRGVIHVHSEVGAGTTITVDLPCASLPLAAQA